MKWILAIVLSVVALDASALTKVQARSCIGSDRRFKPVMDAITTLKANWPGGFSSQDQREFDAKEAATINAAENCPAFLTGARRLQKDLSTKRSRLGREGRSSVPSQSATSADGTFQILSYGRDTEAQSIIENSLYFKAASVRPEEANGMANAVRKLFSIYPAACLEQVGLKNVVIVNSLQVDSQYRTAAPDNASGSLILDAGLLNQSYFRGIIQQRDNYIRGVFHHEFYHFWDESDGGLEDEAWAKLNRPGFEYGGGGSSMRDVGASVWNTNSPGFLNAYSTSALVEDKAEIFAALITRRGEFNARAQRDPILQRKADLLRAQVINFCPAMGGRF